MGLVDLSQRAVLVVGAGKGIGRATARMLGEAGAHTIVLDRHRDRGEEVAASIRADGGRADVVRADVTAPGEIEAALDAARTFAPRLDTLVNITGSATWVPLLELDEVTWERDFAVNLDQHWRVSRAFARQRIREGRPGVICVVGSISGCFAAPGHGAYGAAKAGLLDFVRTAAEEWAPTGIRVNAVVPGSVLTPRIEETLMDPDVEVPPARLARMARPEDVAGPIAYLVSDLARRVTGQTIVIDGGSSTQFPYPLADSSPAAS